MNRITVPPDENQPEVDAEFDTLEGLYAHSLITDAKMLLHQHPELKFEQAVQMLILSNQFMSREGPLFLKSMAQLESDEE